MKHFVLSFALVCLLGGCAVQNPDQLRQDNAGKIQFVVNKGYQEVYRRIVEFEEMPDHAYRSELYTDIKCGKIWFKRAFPPFDTFILIDIIHIEPGVTEVNYYYYFPAWKGFGERIRNLFGDDRGK
jgi:hypothetical protein